LYEASAIRETRKVAREVGRTDEVDDDIDATAFGLFYDRPKSLVLYAMVTSAPSRRT
jgi:hypothetical protein